MYCNLSNTFKRVIFTFLKLWHVAKATFVDSTKLKNDEWDEFYPKIQGCFHWFQRKKYQVHEGKLMNGAIAQLIFLGVNYTKPWFILRGGWIKLIHIYFLYFYYFTIYFNSDSYYLPEHTYMTLLWNLTCLRLFSDVHLILDDLCIKK